MNKGIRKALLVALLVVLWGCDSTDRASEVDLNEVATSAELESIANEAGTTDKDTYIFGFDLRNGPQEDARQYLPLLSYLQQQTEYRFKLHFTDNADELISQLADGRIHFAAIGAGTYLTAQSDTLVVPLVRGVNAEGEAGYRSYVVVAANSPIYQVSELRGRRVAFGSRTSTQGHWIPRIMFDQAGIELKDLAGYTFTGSHRACAESVISGRADACGMQDTLARLLIAEGALRKIAISDVYPSSGIFSHGSVPQVVRDAVGTALVAFDPQGRDRAGLYNWERTEMAGGFATAAESDYAVLGDQARQLGLLPKMPAEGADR